MPKLLAFNDLLNPKKLRNQSISKLKRVRPVTKRIIATEKLITQLRKQIQEDHHLIASTHVSTLEQNVIWQAKSLEHLFHRYLLEELELYHKILIKELEPNDNVDEVPVDKKDETK
jgi:hypothetical protein